MTRKASESRIEDIVLRTPCPFCEEGKVGSYCGKTPDGPFIHGVRMMTDLENERTRHHAEGDQ